MKLRILVAGDATRIADGKRIWSAFESAVALLFEYDELVFEAGTDTLISELAEAQLHQGVGTINVTAALLDAPEMEQHLTLLHECLHLSSFIGSLHEMYAAFKNFNNAYPREVLDRIEAFRVEERWPIADRVNPYLDAGQRLGRHLFEVDAELALNTRYPDYAEARSHYFIQLRKRCFADRPYAVFPAVTRPYIVLLDWLNAELAGYLKGDEAVTHELESVIEQVPGFVEPSGLVIAFRDMLSVKSNDFSKLPQWGTVRYETIVRHVTEEAFTSA